MTLDRIAQTIGEWKLATPEAPVLLMVSGGSDSTALVYVAHELQQRGVLGALAILHVNHQLRGQAANDDAEFTRQLAEALELPFYLVQVDVGEIARTLGENIEAVARHERYAAAQDALKSLCQQAGTPIKEGRIFTAHTQTDRIENFYMRSIVGTGPGGFRAMRYTNGQVARPCLDVTREDLRDFLRRRALDAQADPQLVCIRDSQGNLWREDATNAHTDQFRAFVRHEIVPKARERNPRLEETLCRSLNLIADEDDMLEDLAANIEEAEVKWEYESASQSGRVWPAGVQPASPTACVLQPSFAKHPTPLQRRAIARVLQTWLHTVEGDNARLEAASIEAIVSAFANGAPVSGYTANIQGNLAISANKRGVRIEPMDEYRARRKGK